MAPAWSIVTDDNRPLASMIASVMRTLVPLAKPSSTRSAGSTAASAFGAMALSLPDDTLTLAESVTHEFHHAILSAVTDLTPMTGVGAEILTYAPWREDARSIGALLQGVYAHYGVARYWRQQCRRDVQASDPRASAEFARWRMLVAQAVEDLVNSGALTVHGHELVSTLRAEVASWQSDEVSELASEYADDLTVDHRVRWRLRHLRPDLAAIETLAVAWRRGRVPPITPAAIDAVIMPGPLPSGVDNARSYLLALRYQDPQRFRRIASCATRLAQEHSRYTWLDSADVALASKDYAAAADRYLRRIAGGADPDAWAGLAVARKHTGPGGSARVLAERPEVAAVLYDRLRDASRPDPDQLLVWLSEPDRIDASVPAVQ
jgi:hypothetical protein